MASNVFGIFFIAITFLGSKSQGNLHANEAISVDHHHDPLNDNIILKWSDLRNAIHQGDAITYELGTPRYEILNADEPIEVITPGHPGYYESLRRYEAAAVRPPTMVGNRDDATTISPLNEMMRKRIRERRKNRIAKDEKKIKFIILDSNKRDKNAKIFVKLPKNNEEAADNAVADHTSDDGSGKEVKSNQQIAGLTTHLIGTETFVAKQKEQQTTTNFEDLSTTETISTIEPNAESNTTATDQQLLTNEGEATEFNTESTTALEASTTTTTDATPTTRTNQGQSIASELDEKEFAVHEVEVEEEFLT